MVGRASACQSGRSSDSSLLLFFSALSRLRVLCVSALNPPSRRLLESKKVPLWTVLPPPIPPPRERSSWKSSATCARVSSRCTTPRCRRPSIHVYLHADDMERLRGIVPRIVDEARRALDAELESLNRASLGRAPEDRPARRARRSPRPRAAGRSAFWKTPTTMSSPAISSSIPSWRCPPRPNSAPAP